MGMSNSTTLLQAFRQERHPLAALAALGFAVRLCLIMLGTALSPEALAASGLGVYCQSSQDLGTERNSSASHIGFVCACGPGCVHSCPTPIIGDVDADWRKDTANYTVVPQAVFSDRMETDRSYNCRAIRAPPAGLS